MSTYPDNILVKGNVVNEVDVVDEGDHNILKNEIIALQTYIGTGPQGERANLAARINQMMSGSGGFRLVSGVPTETYPGLYYYRTDNNTLYAITTNNVPQAVGASFGNVVFCYAGGLGQSDNYGFHITPLLTGTLVSGATGFGKWYAASSSFGTIITTKLSKISGMSNITFLSKMLCASSLGTAFCRVDIGSAFATSSVQSGTIPAWQTGVVDISGLTNGSVYDVIISLNSGAGHGFLTSIIGIAS